MPGGQLLGEPDPEPVADPGFLNPDRGFEFCCCCCCRRIGRLWFAASPKWRMLVTPASNQTSKQFWNGNWRETEKGPHILRGPWNCAGLAIKSLVRAKGASLRSWAWSTCGALSLQ